MSIRVLVGEHEELFRVALKAILENNSFEVIGEASNGREVVRLAQILHPEVAVLDSFLPLLNGLDAARALLKSSPETKPILLGTYAEPYCVREALNAGVVGYVLRSAEPSILVRTIREASQGSVYFSPEIGRALLDTGWPESESLSDPLSLREREVLQLIAEGRSNKEMAAILGISVKTSESRRKRIADKLKIRSTAELVRYAIRKSIIKP